MLLSLASLKISSVPKKWLLWEDKHEDKWLLLFRKLDTKMQKFKNDDTREVKKLYNTVPKAFKFLKNFTIKDKDDIILLEHHL